MSGRSSKPNNDGQMSARGDLSARGGGGGTTQTNQPITTGFIAAMSDYQGRVIFGNYCIIHPNCTIISEGGDIIFGDYCIVEEKCKI